MSNPFDNKDGLRGWPDDSPIVPNTSEPQISKRPLPRKWVERLKEKLAEKARANPTIRVEPKGFRVPLGDRWHSEIGQLEMEDDLFSERRCTGCGEKVVKASGDLIEGLWCGNCWNARQENIEHPPAA